MTSRPFAALGRGDQWDGVRVVVAGFDADGYAAADNLLFLGADVTALDESVTPGQVERAELLETLGARVHLEEGATATLPEHVDVVIATHPCSPTTPLLAQAAARGVAVWGDLELAWRLRDEERPAPWLALTGANGKTRTVQMLAAILAAAGLRCPVAGQGARPIVEVVMDPEHVDVLAVAATSTQLHYCDSMAAESAAVLNHGDLVPEWYQDGRRQQFDSTGQPSGAMAYAADAARVFEGVRRACVYNLEDRATEDLVRNAEVVEGARAIGFTLGMPSVGNLGIVEDLLVDRAFIEERATSAAELCTIADLGSSAPDFVANALAAAALARAHGVSQQAVRDGLRSFSAG